MKKLSEIIKQIEDIDGIDSYFLYRDYDNGMLQLNVSFKNEKVDDILLKSDIKQSDSSAFWE